MKKKFLLISTIISSITAVCFLLLFLLTPNKEKAFRNQVRKQHKVFCSSLLHESNAFAQNQMPKHKFIYCEITEDSVKGYMPIIHYDDRTIKLRERALAKTEKYYQLDDSTKITDVRELEQAISFYKNEKYLFSALSPERRIEINKIPPKDSISRVLSVITNLLIGSNNLCIAAYAENDSLKYITPDDICSFYIDLDYLDLWQKEDSKALYIEQSLHDFLLGNGLVKPIPYKFVRMNFRDDKFFICNSGVEKFSAGNAELQRMCMSNHIVVLDDKKPFSLEKRNQELGKNIMWCQSDWLKQTKTKSLEYYNIPPLKSQKNYDLLRFIYLFLFIAFVLISAIFLCLWWMTSKSSNLDDNAIQEESLEMEETNSNDTWENKFSSLNKKYQAALAESKEQAEKIKSLGEKAKLLERDSQSLRENIADLEKEKAQLTRENSTNLQNTSEAKKRYSELVQKYNELVVKYKALVTKNETLVAEVDKKVEDATKSIKLQYGQIEKHYKEILPYYNSTFEIIKQLKPYLQGLAKEKDLRFWDRVLLQQLAIHELLIPLSKIWCKDINVNPVAESALEKMRTDDLLQYILLYLEKTLRYDNITSQEFSQALNEKIPQEIDNYNAKVKQLQVSGISINQNADKKYVECADLMRLKVAQLKLDESFKAKMWSAFGKEFIDQVDETTDKTWFFKYVIALAYYTAEYLQFNANKSTDTSAYYNLTYLLKGFDSNYPKEYEHNYYGKSNSYADRVYEWCKELGIEHLQVLISEYLILP